MDIAQKEKDISAVRKLSFLFIEDYFKNNYYQIFKSTFKPAEWASEQEKLFLHYSREKYFSRSAANLLKTENETERLMNYANKYLAIDVLEEYYNVFASDYPEKTLELFRKVLVSYADRNTGRSSYQHILAFLKKMSRIKGGKKAASDLVAEFRIEYRNRKAMMEILGKF